MPVRNLKFPHLLPDDIEIWERFLALRGNQFDTIDYDVRVGAGRPAPPGSTQNIRKMALDLSKKRIDAVGFTDRETTIIEITVRAGLKAIGQVLTYRKLYQETHADARPIRLLIVAGRLDTDVRSTMNEHDIEISIP